jgi:iron complex transport system ATP-binding protein
MFLEVGDVDCYYDTTRVLEQVTFSVQKGESFGVVGPNGSGKTTLLRCISGILKPRSGIVRLDGVNVHALRPKDIARNIAVVPQSSAINFEFTAQEVAMMGRNPYISRLGMEGAQDFEVVEKAMAVTNTTHLAARPIGTLSGGELQRVTIARALVQEPKLLLLDEPTVHLDIGHQLDIMELIRRLNRDTELTVVSVFHDLNLAAQFCERVMLLDRGMVSAIGTPHQVLTAENIQKAYHVNMLVKQHPLTTSLYVIPFTAVRRPTHGRTRVHIVCGGGSGAQLMTRLYEDGYEVTAGVLNVLDSDYEAAASLNIPTIEEAPFSAITDEAFERNLRLILDADIVLLANAVFGEGNLRNLEAVRNALDQEVSVIVVESTSFPERNFAGQAGDKLYSSIKQRAIVVQKPEDVPENLRRLQQRKKPTRDER